MKLKMPETDCGHFGLNSDLNRGQTTQKVYGETIHMILLLLWKKTSTRKWTDLTCWFQLYTYKLLSTILSVK